VPETEEWKAERGKVDKPPGIGALFGPGIASTTWRALIICAVSLAAHWAFMFWQQKFLRGHAEVRDLSAALQNRAAVYGLTFLMIGSIVGNFIAGWFAKMWGYKRAMVVLFSLYGITMALTFSQTWTWNALMVWFVLLGAWAGVFGLFTMCLPPLFPTMIRTTGAGFCFNIGRLASAGGVVALGTLSTSPGQNLLYASLLFVPAALLAFLLPSPLDGKNV
jgi:MFS family permease